MVDTVQAIPLTGIYLTDAFDRVFCAMNPEARPRYPRTHVEWDEHDYAELCANEVLRNAIADGSLTPLVLRKGKPQRLPRDGWKILGQFPRQDWLPNCFPQTGIYSNFVGPNDPTNPGPPTGRNGKRREVFFDHGEFDGWFQAIFPARCSQSSHAAVPPVQEVVPSPRRGGKKIGDGSHHELDQPLLEEMNLLRREGKAASDHEAARMLAATAHGAGTPESKARRLGRRYKARYGPATITP
jgi:hypothetical protein